MATGRIGFDLIELVIVSLSSCDVRGVDIIESMLKLLTVDFAGAP